MTSLVRLEHVSKNYGRFQALRDISLEIGPGITGLLGPNGAGKTTLIKLLMGLVRLTTGKGEVLGYPLGRGERKIRSAVGYMPEDDCYVPGLSGVEMVQFMARLSGQPAIEGLRRTHEILDFCNIGQERYRTVETYSTGMRQQLKFAQSIVHDPDLLILDEPTAGLDPNERESMLKRIRRLSEVHGKAVLISTHILPDVQAISDQVVIMVKGSVQVVERLEVLRRPTAPAFRLRVIGPQESFIERTVREGFPVTRRNGSSFTIEGLDRGQLGSVWQWAAETGVGIRSLSPERNSLEDVFLAAIREGEDADQ